MENQKRHSRKLLSILLVLCMVLSIVPITAFAAGVNYIEKISVTYTEPDYKAGDAPQAQATVTEGECSVAYEYWREIEQKTEGSVWTGTGRYWYSDSSKMASLAADKQITQFEAGHHYSYNIVLKTNSGYLISDDTIVSVGDYEWGKAGSGMNLEIKEMSTELRIYSPYSIDLLAASTDEVITTVDIGNVWKKLDSSQPVAFTAEVNPNNSACSGKVEIVEEAWEKSTYGESTPITDVIKSTDTSRNPIAGGEYWYSIALKAKEGYVFSDNVTFICEGITYTAQTANTSVSDNGKTFTAWEFLLPVIVSDGADDTVINNAYIENVKFDYRPGDAPQATAQVPNPELDPGYEIAYECWEEMENGEPVAYWYSDESKYPTSAKKITQFEEGKTYMYSIELREKNGRTFPNNCSVVINGKPISISAIVIKVVDGLNVMYVKTIRPGVDKEISVVEINNVTLTFKDGDKPVFSGTVPENAPYGFRCEWWSLDENTGIVSTEPEWGGGIYSNKITAFEAGKTYHYGVYVSGDYDDISPDAKLKINGREVKYTRIGDESDTQSFWVETDLTMTPIADGHTHSYGTDWKYDSANHWHECSCGDKADLTAHSFKWLVDKEATATEKGSKHEECTVCGYKKAAVEIPATGSATQPTNPTKPTEGDKTDTTTPTGGDKPDSTTSTGGKDTTSPQTGDNSNLALWFAVLFISCGGVIGVTVYSKRRKLNKR